MIFKDLDIEKLLELMEKYDTAEISLRDGKTAIEVKRLSKKQEFTSPPEHIRSHLSPLEHAVYQSEQSTISHRAPLTEQLVDNPGSEPLELNIKEVLSPLVGTFYRAPSPDAHPYVEVGDSVKAGDTLCIVEAMKNMNEIESDVAGTIKEICIQNAELVEYGQVMFKIEMTDSHA